MRIARNHQCGLAFARRICSQARYFEVHGMLEVNCQGKQKNVGLMGRRIEDRDTQIFADDACRGGMC